MSYVAPWDETANIEPSTVDLIMSQSVIEHVDDIEKVVETCATWLRPGGWMSHQVDYSSHGITPEWNGHWGISDLTWRLIVGRRQYLLNRRPASHFLSALQSAGFDEARRLRKGKAGGIRRSSLARRFRDMSEDDFGCATLFVQANLNESRTTQS